MQGQDPAVGVLCARWLVAPGAEGGLQGGDGLSLERAQGALELETRHRRAGCDGRLDWVAKLLDAVMAREIHVVAGFAVHRIRPRAGGAEPWRGARGNREVPSAFVGALESRGSLVYAVPHRCEGVVHRLCHYLRVGERVGPRPLYGRVRRYLRCTIEVKNLVRIPTRSTMYSTRHHVGVSSDVIPPPGMATEAPRRSYGSFPVRCACARCTWRTVGTRAATRLCGRWSRVAAGPATSSPSYSRVKCTARSKAARPTPTLFLWVGQTAPHARHERPVLSVPAPIPEQKPGQGQQRQQHVDVVA